MIGVHVRWSIASDLPAVVSVASKSGHETTSNELRAMLARQDVVGYVAEREESIAGFAAVEFHKRRYRVLKFFVIRGSGAADALVDHLIKKLHPLRRHSLEIDVVESNLPTQLFLRSKGFRAVRILRGGDEGDAYRFRFSMREAVPDDAVRQGS